MTDFSADDLGFSLVPADDVDVSPEDRIAAAAAEALGEIDDALVEDDAPEPFGTSWAFDFERRRFIRQGGSPARVFGHDTLSMRCLVALNSARFAHAIFSEEFGVDGLNEWIGGTDATEIESDVETGFREALLALDRVADVALDVTMDRTTGVVLVTNFYVTTDEDVELPFDDLTVTLESNA